MGRRHLLGLCVGTSSDVAENSGCAEFRRGAEMSVRAGSRDLAEIRERISGRDLAILGMISDLHLMSGRQIEMMFFAAEMHVSLSSASRTARRVMSRLARERLLVRLDRQIGGVRAGSKSFIYCLGPVGHRLLNLSDPRPRYREPSIQFIEHTLAVTELLVQVTEATRRDRCELIRWQSEPRCWRAFNTAGGRTTLRPDLFLALGVGDYEYRFFIEVDRNTEHLPTIVRKAKLYDSYYRSGREQSRDGLFPSVLFITSDVKRSELITRSLQQVRGLTPGLLTAVHQDDALQALLGGKQ